MPPVARPQNWVWLLGKGHYQRQYMQYWMMTSFVYVLILLLQVYAVAEGLYEPASAIITRVLVLTGVVGFFIAMRSGWSQRFLDPALTTSQMAYGLLIISVSYVMGPNVRIVLILLAPLVLLFGAFTSSPRQSWVMAGLAILLQGIAGLMSTSPSITQWTKQPLASQSLEGLVFVSCVVAYGMTAAMAGRLSRMRGRLQNQRQKLNEALAQNQVLVRQDSLTALPNRRHAMELLANEEQRALRQQSAPCVAMLDIDYFKRVNDTHGHAAGDELLRLFSASASAALRNTDVLTRWGGEEFMLLMPGTSLSQAVQGIDRVRQHLAQPQVWQEHPKLRVTFSAGVALFRPQETMMQTVERADAALYCAKQQGRNCTVSAEV